MKSVIVILGDQLSKKIAALKSCEKSEDLILMCEVINECTNPKHHQKKIVYILSAMRHFAQGLKGEGFNVEYIKLDDPENSGSFASEIIRISKKYQIKNFKVTDPGEYRVLEELQNIKDVNLKIYEDDRFLCSKEEFKKFASAKKQLIMESFYRYMRIKHGILVDKDQPIGGKWNFDSENRKPPKLNMNIPEIIKNEPDAITQEVIKLVENKFSNHFGDIRPFNLAINRSQALIALDDFIDNRLENFGSFQDAMIEGEDYLYHSNISLYLNNGLLDALEIIKKAEEKFKKDNLKLNSIEGFIRQILGWREFVRGIYWLYMPKYKELNFLSAKNKLPKFYWDGITNMNCIKECVRNTKQNAYAHHIQRLMVLGNFALIASVNPKELNEWYLIVYSDAYEWVEMPNVSGMVLFADGGILATKPYAASGSYINKMSNYCKNCSYDVKKKTGKDACPFNYLYWDFLIKNKDIFNKNHRMKMIYNVLEKFTPEKISQIKSDSQQFLKQIN